MDALGYAINSLTFICVAYFSKCWLFKLTFFGNVALFASKDDGSHASLYLWKKNEKMIFAFSKFRINYLFGKCLWKWISAVSSAVATSLWCSKSSCISPCSMLLHCKKFLSVSLSSLSIRLLSSCEWTLIPSTPMTPSF